VSTENGPKWYPSKQFTHTPDVPGAPAYTAAAPSTVATPAPSQPGGVRRFLNKLFRRGETK
jgi:hypothetical protein